MEAEELADAGVRFFAIFEASRAVAMGALKPISEDHGELKSMHVIDEARGRGLARGLLRHLIEEARAAGMSRVSLETGSQQAFGAARALYRAEGFRECPPFADYGPDPNSVFLTLML